MHIWEGMCGENPRRTNDRRDPSAREREVTDPSTRRSILSIGLRRGCYGGSVCPKFTLTWLMSEALMGPLAFTSVRKVVVVTDPLELALVCRYPKN